jgi:hypothetical protein
VTETRKSLRDWEAKEQEEQKHDEYKGFGPFLCPECGGTSSSHYRTKGSSWETMKKLGVHVDPSETKKGYFFVDRAFQCDSCAHLIPDHLCTIKADLPFSDMRMKWLTAFKRFEQRDRSAFSELLPVPRRHAFDLIAAADRSIAKKWEESVKKSNEYRKALGNPPVSGTYEDWISGKYDADDP